MRLNLKYHSKETELFLESNLLNNLDNFIDNSKKYFILTDDIVAEHYLDKLKRSLKNSNSLIIPKGEESKNINNLTKLLESLVINNYSKSDYIIALGGGVITDLGSFSASIYKRGMKLILIPTSLLAQVDASMGGKTGIDLTVNNEVYKNQVGSIYQADAIFIDPTVLTTLNKRDYLSGMAEVIKYALCSDENLFESLFLDYKIEDIIKSCVKIKTNITIEDEFEKDKRIILNFGHTIGHAIESLSNFSLTHGEAIALGMLYETNDKEIRNKLIELYDKLGISYKFDFKLDDLKKFILQDKKVKTSKILIPEVEEIGKTTIKQYNLDDYLGGLDEFNW